MHYVLSYCAEQAAGLLIMHREAQHNEKAYVVGGMPAHNGVAAAQMVASGFTGVEDVLSGEGNFLSVFSPESDPEALVRGLGRDYEILRCSIKYWPAGGPIQAPLHVLHDLMAQHGFKAGDVEKLVARMPDKALQIVDNRDMPDICVQHLLAVMLLDGTVTFKTTHDFARMKDPRVLALRRNRIETIGDPTLTTPLRRWSCAMEITLKDGRKLAHQTTTAKGCEVNPLTRQDEEEKALDLMAPVLGTQRSRKLIEALFNIETIQDARTLRRLYTA
jgi:2-methylcitrate dehydratase PrpD